MIKVLLTLVLTMAVPELSDSGVPRSQSDILAGYFAAAQKRLADLVLHPGNTGTTEKGQQYRQAKAAVQIAQVDKLLLELKGLTATWLGDDANVVQAIHDARMRADRQAEASGIRPAESPLSGSFDRVDYRSAAVVAQDTAIYLNNAADAMGTQAARTLRKVAQVGVTEPEINRIIATGILSGRPADTIRDLAKDLRAVHGGTLTLKDKNGNPRDYDVKDYAELVVRTRTREAVETARHERLAEVGIDLVAIIGRKSSSFCTAFLGQVFSLSGRHPKYPAFARLPGGGPPFHPRCSKSTRPFVPELAGAKQLADAAILPDAAKLLGQDVAAAQRSYKDLQIRQQIDERYADKAGKLFPKPSPIAAAATPRVETLPNATPTTPLPAGVRPAPSVQYAPEVEVMHARTLAAREGARARAAQINVEMGAISDRIRAAHLAGDPAEAARVRAAGNAEWDRLYAERGALELRERDEAFAALVAGNAPATFAVRTTSKAMAAQLAKTKDPSGNAQGVEAFRLMVGAGVIDDAPVSMGQTAGRAHYDVEAAAVRVGTYDKARVAVHELGHHLECSNAAVRDAAAAFLARRTAGEPLRRLADVLPDRGFRADEESRPDAFFHPYIGKEYFPGVTEVVAMGFDRMFTDPVGFAIDDPDHFKLIASFMRLGRRGA